MISTEELISVKHPGRTARRRAYREAIAAGFTPEEAHQLAARAATEQNKPRKPAGATWSLADIERLQICCVCEMCRSGSKVQNYDTRTKWPPVYVGSVGISFDCFVQGEEPETEPERRISAAEARKAGLHEIRRR